MAIEFSDSEDDNYSKFPVILKKTSPKQLNLFIQSLSKLWKKIVDGHFELVPLNHDTHSNDNLRRKRSLNFEEVCFIFKSVKISRPELQGQPVPSDIS